MSEPLLWTSAFAFMLGAVVGSFLNVVIHRLPRGESIVYPGSRCPGCLKPIPAWANVPIVAWLALRGRCAKCGAPISLRYPAVEALTGALFLAFWLHDFWLHEESVARVVAQWCMASALVVITFIDWDFKIVPNAITYPGIPLALATSIFLPPGDWLGPYPYWANALAGCLLGGGVMYAVSSYYEWRRGEIGLGMGDVKLIAMLGAFLGLDAVFGVLLLGSLLGIVQWIVLRSLGAAGRKTRIAFAPALAAAGVVHQLEPVFVSQVLARVTGAFGA